MFMEKFFTKENLVIAVAIFIMIVQSNYFATKLDLAQLKNEMLMMKIELKKHNLDTKYQLILTKLDKLHN